MEWLPKAHLMEWMRSLRWAKDSIDRKTESGRQWKASVTSVCGCGTNQDVGASWD